MPNYWITTHWPNVEPDDSPARHIFFKTGGRRQLPQPGDIVFIYESAYAVVSGKVVSQAYRCQFGRKEIENVPLGRSAIVGKAEVVGMPREVQPQDIVRDYGNLGEWSVIPCTRQVKVQELAKADLMLLLGYPRRTPPRFLTLWQIPDVTMAQRLLDRLEDR